ncbi:402_t:CDS:2 [Cetraspora pellucida]|uniref:402_t:CDS:1 n=1 Tax=Cetraspora pellucida TaxID=1433469 RepID=A0A9N9I1M7_9GLOM|nr:402_t:CDS:2 [Cetraspora pellucida]
MAILYDQPITFKVADHNLDLIVEIRTGIFFNSVETLSSED